MNTYIFQFLIKNSSVLGTFVSKTMQSNILYILFLAKIISDNGIILLIPLQKKKKAEILSIIFPSQALGVLIPSVVQSVYIIVEWFRPGLEPRKSVAHLHPP